MAKKDDWEIYTVVYRLPLFGTEGEFQKETHSMMISTQGGREDVKKAVLQYHKGAKIESVMNRLESIVNDTGGGIFVKTIKTSKKKK